MFKISGPTFDEVNGDWVSIYEWFEGIDVETGNGGGFVQEEYRFASWQDAIDFDVSDDVNKW